MKTFDVTVIEWMFRLDSNWQKIQMGDGRCCTCALDVSSVNVFKLFVPKLDVYLRFVHIE